MRKDIDYYFTKIEAVHPNMYWNKSKKEIAIFRDKLEDECKDSMTCEEFGLMLLQSNHLFDSHTGIEISDLVNSIFENYCEKYQAFFPWVNYNGKDIYMKGEENRIISINSIPINQILENYFRYYGSDLSKLYRINLINLPSVFQIALILQKINPPYHIQFEDSDLNKITLDINNGMGFEELSEEMFTVNRIYYPEDAYDFKIFPKDSIAIIYYWFCVSPDEYANFDSFLKTSFRQIEKYHIQHLFIDVSHNRGGNSGASELFTKYLINEHLSKGRIVSKDTIKYAIYPGALISERRKKNRNKLQSFRGNQGLIIGENVYTGKIYLCQSVNTQSAGPYLIEMLKALRDKVLIVGTIDGTPLPAYSQGNSFRLPYSQLEASVAERYYTDEQPIQIRDKQGFLLPDLEYFQLLNNQLEFEDCKKIINIIK